MDYFVMLRNGAVNIIRDVISAPVIVENDGVATEIKSGVYRDLVPAQQGAITSTSTNLGGAGIAIEPQWTSGTPNVDTYETHLDDRIAHEPPRQLSFVESHWKFETTTHPFFIPVKDVLAMGNEEPSI